MSQRIQLRRGLAAVWTAANPILSDGELGFEHDTAKLKIGDGITPWGALTYFTGRYNSAAVNITGGQIDGITIGGRTPGAGTFATLIANGDFYLGNAGQYCAIHSAQLRMNSGMVLMWTDSSTGGTPDVLLLRDGAARLAQRNGVNAQTFILSATYTDPSNYSQFQVSAGSPEILFGVAEAGTAVGTLTRFAFTLPVSVPQLNLASSGAPASPAPGNIYSDGAHIYWRDADNTPHQLD